MKQLFRGFIPEKFVHGITRRLTGSLPKEKLLTNWIVPLKKTPSFYAKFLAGELKDRVELILTCCNMTSEHFFFCQPGDSDAN